MGAAPRIAGGLMLAAVCVAAALSAAQPQDIQPPSQAHFPLTPRLTVSGEAELRKPADQLQVRLSVVTEAEQSQAAMDDNSRKMQEVVAAIEKAGLTKQEYQTGQFSVQPVHSRPPRQPEPNWRPRIVGYTVSNTLNIRTQKLAIAGKLLQAATDAGVNSIDSISFDLADRRKHRAEAIQVATKNAVADASVLADAAGVKVVRVLSINLDGAEFGVPRMDQYMMGRAMAAEAAPAPPIEPGDVTVTAHVTIVYEIGQ